MKHLCKLLIDTFLGYGDSEVEHFSSHIKKDVGLG